MEFKVIRTTSNFIIVNSVNITRMEFKGILLNTSSEQLNGVNITRMEFKVLDRLKGITAVNECKYN